MGNKYIKDMRDAISYNDYETVITLIDKGYNVNSYHSELGLIYIGAPSLQWSYQTDENDAFGGRDNKFPLEYNICFKLSSLLNGDIFIKWTALMYSACLGRIDITEILLNKGADKTLRDEAGQTAYEIAFKMNKRGKILELLKI